MDRIAYSLLALSGGVLVAAQAPINARLRTVVGSPLTAALVSFAVGCSLLLALTLAAGEIGAVTKLGDGPWWAYLGGICGTALVVATLIAAPRVGVLTTFVAVIFGEVVMATAIDRYGWFGVPRIPVTWDRMVAVMLLAISLALIARRR
jgi:bacterial/archaeal transporter family-2 protein